MFHNYSFMYSHVKRQILVLREIINNLLTTYLQPNGLKKWAMEICWKTSRKPGFLFGQVALKWWSGSRI